MRGQKIQLCLEEDTAQPQKWKCKGLQLGKTNIST